MIRHPFYYGLCLLAAGYLSLANARGWSFWHTLSRPFSSSAGGSSGYHGGVNHK